MIKLIIREFFFLVLISNIVAWPIAWYLMDKWLQNFAYRTPFGIWIFILTGILSLIIVILTMSLQTFKAANTNPVEVLKYE
jgi:putative ABC transport system permease protein